MQLKKKKKAAIVSLALGAVIFGTSAFAELNLSGGYELGKAALKQLTDVENYTMKSNMKIVYDGEVLEHITLTEKYDRNGDARMSRIEEDTGANYGGEQPYVYESYIQDGKRIYLNNGKDATVYDVYVESYAPGTLDLMCGMDKDEKKQFNKMMRFMELAGDTFVGDLKNNVVYVSGDDSSSSYEVALSAVQIPELVNAGLSVIFSSGVHSDIDISDPVVQDFTLKFTLDKQKRLSNGMLSVTMSQGMHELLIEFDMDIYDYGTTKPDRVDISKLNVVASGVQYRDVIEIQDDQAE